MDKHGRRSINRVFDEAEGTAGKAAAPTFPLSLSEARAGALTVYHSACLLSTLQAVEANATGLDPVDEADSS